MNYRYRYEDKFAFVGQPRKKLRGQARRPKWRIREVLKDRTYLATNLCFSQEVCQTNYSTVYLV
jgi:hypothetical protein